MNAVMESPVVDARPSILFVDDELNILRSLKWLFQADYRVTTANSGAEALELLRARPFDIVVSDQRMPEMTGVELLREVKELAPQTVRILLTGYADLDAVVGSVNESEVFRFINKPWDNDELRSVMGDAAQRVGDVQIAPVRVVEVADETPIEAQAHNVLLLDNDLDTFEFLREALGKSFPIRHATDVEAARAALAAHDVGVIVTETHLGDVDATALVAEFKRNHPDVVTVVLTEHSDANAVIRLINDGQVFRFLPKPVKAGLFRLSMRSAMQKHEMLRGQDRGADPSEPVPAAAAAAPAGEPAAAGAPPAQARGFWARLLGLFGFGCGRRR